MDHRDGTFSIKRFGWNNRRRVHRVTDRPGVATPTAPELVGMHPVSIRFRFEKDITLLISNYLLLSVI